MIAPTTIRRARRTWARLVFQFYWFRVFWCLTILGYAVGLILVADPPPPVYDLPG